MQLGGKVSSECLNNAGIHVVLFALAHGYNARSSPWSQKVLKP